MTDEQIFEIFNHRCVMCWLPATEINHIVLRSRDASRIDDWTNKVPLCSKCHQRFHDGGVTKEKIADMRGKRIERLLILGKPIV